MNNKYVISFFTIVIIVIIAGYFLLSFPKNSLYYWSLASLLFSCLLTMVLITTIIKTKINEDNIIYNTCLSSVIYIYLTAVLTSVVFTKNFVGNLNMFILIQLIINATFFMLILIIIAAAKYIHQKSINSLDKLQNGEYNKVKRGGM